MVNNNELGHWGCKKDNLTGLHLKDILEKNESPLVIRKMNRFLSQYYNKMCGLIGTGQYQEFYMDLVKQDAFKILAEKNWKFACDKSETHTRSLIMILHRGMMDMDFDVDNQFPLF